MTDKKMILGRTLKRNGEIGATIGIPPDTWNRHLLITGQTGTGKTTTATTAITTAHQVSDGPTIVIDPKGSGWLRDVARAEYAQTGTLEDILYFDCAAFLPAMSVFDIRRSVNAGLKRDNVVEDTAEHFCTLIEHVKPKGFDTIRSKDVIRYLIKAKFDTDDAFELDSLFEETRQLYKTRSQPDVSNPRHEALLENLVLGRKQKVDNVIDGALTRIEKFYSSNYLHPLFNYVPTETAEAFTFDDWLAEDVLILIDLGEPADRIQRVLANLFLEQLRLALQRQRRTARQTDHPQVLLFIDEVANLRVDSPLQTLLSMGREFGIGVVPMLQYPKQLETEGNSAANADVDLYTEVLNNCHTMLSGALTTDEGLIQAFAGDHMSAAEIGNRLNNLPPGRWFFQPPSTREQGATQSFDIAEPPLPPGHPDGTTPLSESQQEAFEDALRACRDRTRADYGVAATTGDRGLAGRVSTAATAQPQEDPLVAAIRRNGGATTFPLLDSLPGEALYESQTAGLRCASCGETRPATFEGLLDTIACHGSVANIERTEIPPVQLGLTVPLSEVTSAPVEPRLVCALQIIANMALNRYSRLEVDLVHDSPLDLLKQFGVDSADIQTLTNEQLITVDSLRGYSYYTVTKAGRNLLDQPHRKGVEWGHTTGDNTETLLHRAMVEALCRYAEQEYRNDDNSPITRVDPYFELQECSTAANVDLDGGTRFDVIGRDADGRIRLLGEAERQNNDAAEAAVRDFDQIATIEPDHALWVVPTSSRGHDAVLTPLADPPADLGCSRIDSYSENTRIPTLNSFDEPGMTGIFTLNEIRKQLTEPQLDPLLDTWRTRTGQPY